jgi:uncharacterized protein (DUF697 family)/GTPase Era involved in 16S rRNA processing
MATKGKLEDGVRQQLSETLLRLEELLGRYATSGMKERVAEARRLLVEQRPPRLAVVGRRGSGKSSLLNALFGEKVAELGHEKSQTGEAAWFEYRGARGAMDVLDTRGFQEGSSPEAPDSAATAMSSLCPALRAKAPDAIVFVVRASDVDSAIEEDVRLLSQLLRETDAHHGGKTAVLALVTHCDQVEPQRVRLHDSSKESPQDVAEKLARIETIKRLLERKLGAVPELRDHLVSVLGVSTYQSWRQDNTRRADERWRIDDLVEFLFEELPREAQLEFARFAKIRKVQHDIAGTLTTTIAGACAAMAAAPIPIADIVPITSAQTTLVLTIGYVSGRHLSMGTAAEFLGALGVNVGAAFAFREAARALAKLVAPGAGALVSSTIAYAGTASIGKAAAAYFIDGVNKDAAKRIFDSAFARAKK